MRNVYSCQEIAPISDKKKLNALPNMMDFEGNYLSNDVLEISMYDYVDRHGPLDINLMNEIINHDFTCKMRIKPRYYLVC